MMLRHLKFLESHALLSKSLAAVAWTDVVASGTSLQAQLDAIKPLDADKGAGKTLIYFLAHDSREAAAASWKKFRDDADWVKARTASEKNGKLTEKVESVFLKPTDYSALK